MVYNALSLKRSVQWRSCRERRVCRFLYFESFGAIAWRFGPRWASFAVLGVLRPGAGVLGAPGGASSGAARRFDRTATVGSRTMMCSACAGVAAVACGRGGGRMAAGCGGWPRLRPPGARAGPSRACG